MAFSVSFYKRDVDEQIKEYQKINDIISRTEKDITKKRGFIDKLKKREDRFLKECFNGIDREELRKNFNTLHTLNTGLEKLSGQELWKIISLYNFQNDEEEVVYQKQFEDWINDPNGEFQRVLKENLLKDNPLEKTFLEFVRNPLTDDSGNLVEKQVGSGLVTSLPSLRTSNMKELEEKLSTLMVGNLAKVTQYRIKAISKNSGLDKRITVSKGHDKNSLEIKFKHSDDNVLDWWGITKGQKASDLKHDPFFANSFFRDQLIKYIRTNSNVSIPKLEMIVDYVLRKNTTAIFIGKNSNNIAGLLGEIQALAWLSLLLGSSFSLSDPKQLNWAATQKDTGKQYHADITLKEFGLQVKNTAKNQIDEITFEESRLDTFLSYTENFLSIEEINIIKGIYLTHSFNVPYVSNKRPFEEGYNEIYSPTTWEDLEKLVTLADKLLNLLGFNFMYIGLGDATKNELGNLVFLLGGKDLIYASEIVYDIVKNIESEIQNFRIKKEIKSSYTIVNFLNENWSDQESKGWNHVGKDSKGSYYPKGSVRKVTALVSNNVENNYKIFMHSSYDFTEIIKKLSTI